MSGWEALDDAVTEAVIGGFPVDYVLDLPLPELPALLKSLERVQSRRLVEQSWIDLATSQGSGKDVKKILSARTTKAKSLSPSSEGSGMAALSKQMGVRAPRRKKA